MSAEERISPEEARPRVVVFGRVVSYPWWPAIVARCPKSGEWKDAQDRRWVFFFNDKTGAWLKVSDMRPYDSWYRESLMESNQNNPKYRKYMARIERACKLAEEFIISRAEHRKNRVRSLSEFSTHLTHKALWGIHVPETDSESDDDVPTAAANGKDEEQIIREDETTARENSSSSPQGSLADGDDGPIANGKDGKPSNKRRRSSAPATCDVEPPSSVDKEGGKDAPEAPEARPKRKRTKSTRFQGFIDPFQHRSRSTKTKEEPQRRSSDVTPQGFGETAPTHEKVLLKLRRTPQKLNDDSATNSTVKPEASTEPSLGHSPKPLTRSAANESAILKSKTSKDALKEADGQESAMENGKSVPKLAERVTRKSTEKSSGKVIGKSSAAKSNEAQSPTSDTAVGLVARAKTDRIVLKINSSKLHDALANSIPLPLPAEKSAPKPAQKIVAKQASKPAPKPVVKAASKSGQHKQVRTTTQAPPRTSRATRLSSKRQNESRESSGEETPPDIEKVEVGAPPKRRKVIGSVRAPFRSVATGGIDTASESTDTEDEGNEGHRAALLVTGCKSLAGQAVVEDAIQRRAGRYRLSNAEKSPSPGSLRAAESELMHSLLHRVSALEEHVCSLQAKLGAGNGVDIGEDASAATLKSSVDALIRATQQFAKSRRYDARAISKGIDILWPKHSGDEVSPDDEVARTLARSLVWAAYNRAPEDFQ